MPGVDLSVAVDGVLMEANLPEIPPASTAARVPVSLRINVLNLGSEEAEDVEVMFIAVSSSSNTHQIGIQTIERIEGGRHEIAELSWRPTLDAAEIVVRVDARSRIPETNEINNTASQRFVFNTFSATPEKGSNGNLFSWDGHLRITIPANVLPSQVIIGIEKVQPLPDISNQSALSYMPLPTDSRGSAYRISFPDADDDIVNKSRFLMDLAISYEPLTEGNVGEDRLGIYHRDEETSHWNRDGIDREEVQVAEASAKVDRAGVFSLLSSTDQTPPIISLSIDDRQLHYDGKFASRQPKLIVFVEDDSGVGQIELKLNSVPLLLDDVDRFDSLGDRNTVLVEHQPTLDLGTHFFEVGAADLIGNSSTENISFEVGGELQLKAVANRPNPFSSETWLTYVLTQETNAVRIKIYSTSGRLIYEILDAPQMVGYNEVRWTGVDRDDEPVGNGVYLYKITVIGETQQKLTQMHKMVLLR